MRYFPLYISSRGLGVVLVGGGEVAEAKLRLLMKSQARLRVVCPNPSQQILNWAKADRLELRTGLLKPKDLEGCRLAYAASSDETQNHRLAEWAREQGLLFNWVDLAEASDFITPALVERGPLSVAISSEGLAPVLTRKVKQDLERRLSPSLGPILENLAPLREESLRWSGSRRRRFWNTFFSGGAEKAYDDKGTDGVRDYFEQLKRAPNFPKSPVLEGLVIHQADPHRLSLRAAALLDQAECLIVDKTMPPAFLELARREAHIIEHESGQPLPESGLRLLFQPRFATLLKEAATLARQGLRMESALPEQPLPFVLRLATVLSSGRTVHSPLPDEKQGLTHA